MTILFTLFIFAAFLNRKNPYILTVCLMACFTELSNLIEIPFPLCFAVYAPMYAIALWIAALSKTKQGSYYACSMAIAVAFTLGAAVAYSFKMPSFWPVYENVMMSVTIMELIILIGMNRHVGRIIVHSMDSLYIMLESKQVHSSNKGIT